MSSLPRLEREQQDFLIFISNLHITLSYSFGIETTKTARKLYPIPDQNGQRVYPFSDRNGAKTLPDGSAHTYMAYIREFPRPGMYGYTLCNKD